MARLAEQSRGSGAEARPHCQPHAPTARVTVPPHTEFHRAVAGVPLSLAQPAAPVHCHILPGITPARTLQRQWHRAGGRAQHWHHSDPPQPLTPPSTHRLCRWMKPRKEPLRRVVRGFSVKSLRAHRSSIPFGIPSLAGTRGTPGTSPNLRRFPCTHPPRPRPWGCSPTPRAQRSLQSC